MSASPHKPKPSKPRVIGVRHHSPACARLVQERIRTLRPSVVLIEGPVEMNPRIDEFFLGHSLPIAVFSYFQEESVQRVSWSPFCEYSPEWVAMTAAREVGAEIRFIDLPTWSRAHDDERVNRYSDEGLHSSSYVRALCDELRIDGMDALWDHLFEQEIPADDLEERLSAYFEGLRGDLDEENTANNHAREAFMASFIAEAMAKKGDGETVLVVCGGWHKPALETLWKDAGSPELPAVPEEARADAYLVPYAYERMDSFGGYQSGMPSPAWYDTLWKHGGETSVEMMLRDVTTSIRAEKLALSAADLIGAMSMVDGLMRLRSHPVATRVDLLDGIAAALLKDPQSAPFPWTSRGSIAEGTDPRVTLILRTLRGDARGRLDADTPAPPLVADAENMLKRIEAHVGAIQSKRTITLDLTKERDRETSQLLHRFSVISVPGFVRKKGPGWATEGALKEVWSVEDHLDRRGALIEASVFGGTVELAVLASLRARTNELLGILSALGAAVFCGLLSLASELIAALGVAAQNEHRLAPLGDALSKLLALYRHDVLFGAMGEEALLSVLEALVHQLMWTLESHMAPLCKEELASIVALRDAHRHAKLGSGAPAVMRRRMNDAEAPPALVGAALGFLWSEGCIQDRRETTRVIRGANLPDRIGHFLHGLFLLARGEVTSDADVVATLDEIVSGMEEENFLDTITQLRLAFSVFPTRERASLAEQIVGIRGGTKRDAAMMTQRLSASVETLTRARALETRVDAIESLYGLGGGS
ncbi:MAG: hypothetical protein ACI9KE_002373 [Polyangiales bacterium]|jgi:hypothetical protein